jgi:hypothetical protein
VSALFECWFKGERRLAPRVADDLSVSIHPQDLSDPIPGVARDLSMGGICVATRIPFACSDILRIALHAPGRAISPEVKQLWQQYEPSEKVVLTGFAFGRLNEVERHAIAELLSASLRRIAEVLQSSLLPKLGVADVMRLAEAVRFLCFRAGHVVYGTASGARVGNRERGLSSRLVAALRGVAGGGRARGSRNRCAGVRTGESGLVRQYGNAAP